MQSAPDNAFLESSEGHQNTAHINTLATLLLKKCSHRRSDSMVAIAPSVMNDSSSATFVEVENTTAEEPSVEDSEEVAEEVALVPRNGQPQSDAQRLAALVRSRMEEEEPLSEGRPPYPEDSGYEQSARPSAPNSPDLSMHPSDLIYIDSILAQDNTREMGATAPLRKRLSLRSRMRKLSILNLHRKEKGSGR
jgi:hypothetical protein